MQRSMVKLAAGMARCLQSLQACPPGTLPEDRNEPMATTTSPHPSSPGYFTQLGLIVLAVVASRLVVVWLTPLDLFYDEAQYWFWGQHPALGYFSKPPLVGWQIGLSTALCGNSEACIRSSAPLFHGLTTLLVYGLAASLYPARTAFLAALAYLLAIAVSASSLLMSTDVPLLACWVGALWAFVRFNQAPGLGLALIMGLCIAIGLNAKYAMIYFPLCALGYLVFTADRRALLKLPSLWAGLVLSLCGFIPNLIWNARHGFITFSHTGENIAGGGLRLDVVSFLEFFASQFAIAGPVLFAGFLYALVKRWGSGRKQADRLLLWFSLPILVLLGVQAFQSSANYNWAATAFPALVILATAILLGQGKWAWVRLNLVVCAALAFLLAGASLGVLAVRPDNPIVAQTNLEDMFGWAEHADVLNAELDRIEPDTIVLVGRRYAAGFSFYLRDRTEPMAAFLSPGAPPRNHFEFIAPWSAPAPGERAVILSPGNVRPLPQARLAGVVEANDGAAPFRSDTYLFLVEGPARQE